MAPNTHTLKGLGGVGVDIRLTETQVVIEKILLKGATEQSMFRRKAVEAFQILGALQ